MEKMKEEELPTDWHGFSRMADELSASLLNSSAGLFEEEERGSR